MKTTLKGPYDAVDYEDKVPVHVKIPETLYIKWFRRIFYCRGAQDRIMANLLHIFLTRCQQQQISEESKPVNEKVARKVLLEFEQIIKDETTKTS